MRITCVHVDAPGHTKILASHSCILSETQSSNVWTLVVTGRSIVHAIKSALFTLRTAAQIQSNEGGGLHAIPSDPSQGHVSQFDNLLSHFCCRKPQSVHTIVLCVQDPFPAFLKIVVQRPPTVMLFPGQTLHQKSCLLVAECTLSADPCHHQVPSFRIKSCLSVMPHSTNAFQPLITAVAASDALELVPA